MLHNKMDLTKHVPKQPVLKVIATLFASVGLLGLWGSLIHADLQIQSAINNVISTFQELRITTDGSPQGTTKVVLSTGGIRVDTAALGGTSNGVLKVTPAGYVFRGMISGENIAPYTITGLHIKTGSITTGHLSFLLTGGSGGGSATFSCPAGQAVTSVTSGVVQCAAIIGTGNCGLTGTIQGWSSTGLILCNYGSGGGQILPSGGLWHQSTANTSDIFYGTRVDDNDGNVAVGLNSPSAKLHVKGAFRVDTSGSVSAYATGGGAGGAGGSIYQEVAGMKGSYAPYCNSMVDCIQNSAYNPYISPPNLKVVEVVGSYVNVYDEDPNQTTYHWLYTTQYPRCSCDTSASTVDCSSTNVSFHTDPYCVDVASNVNDATYPGPGGIPGFPYTRIPVQFYAYAGPNGNTSYTITGANPGIIAKSARVGVNTLTPTASLDVVGNIRFRSYMGAGVRNLGVDANGNIVLMPLNLNTNPWQNAGGGVIYYNGGNVGINTNTPRTNLHVMGDILATNYYLVSDESLKTNINVIESALSKLNSINGYSYNRIGTNKASIGVLAQEVEAVMPELVRENEDGFKSVEYPNLIALVIEAMKELNTRADELQGEYGESESVIELITRFEENQNVLAELEARVSSLENNMDDGGE